MDVRLVLVRKDGQVKAFTLPSTVTTIGRKHSCDMRIPLMIVSKKHCKIYQEQGDYKIKDLGSRNGTIINGKKVDESSINAGDMIEIGTVRFVLQIDNVPDEESIKIQLEGIDIAQKTKKAKETVMAAKSQNDPDDDLDDFFTSQLSS